MMLGATRWKNPWKKRAVAKPQAIRGTPTVVRVYIFIRR